MHFNTFSALCGTGRIFFFLEWANLKFKEVGTSETHAYLLSLCFYSDLKLDFNTCPSKEDDLGYAAGNLFFVQQGYATVSPNIQISKITAKIKYSTRFG